MGNYIMIEGNIATNIIVADNKEETESVLNCTLVELTDGIEYQIGWIWDGTQFTDPNPEEPIDETS
jgi:hypothetical protein